MPKRNAQQMLGTVPLFEGLSKRDLAAVFKLGKEVEFSNGSQIVKEGSAGVGFHLITNGTAKVIMRGRTRARLRPGDFFGEISVIDRGPRTATVQAEGDVRTFSIASWDFLGLIDTSPTIARKLLVELCSRLRSCQKSLTD